MLTNRQHFRQLISESISDTKLLRERLAFAKTEDNNSELPLDKAINHVNSAQEALKELIGRLDLPVSTKAR